MKNYNLNHFIEWATKAQADFLAMSVRDQIIVYALSVAIAVLSLALAYWVVKGSLALTYLAVKGSLYLSYYAVVLSLLIPIGILRLVMEPVKNTVHRAVQRPLMVHNPDSEEQIRTEPIAKTVLIREEPHQYCPQCGKEFSNTMEEAMHKTGATFCEYCGVKAQIRA